MSAHLDIRFELSSIWFKRSRFDIFAIRFEDLNPDKSAACLQTQNEMHESSKHFCFGCSLMSKVHRTNWLINIVSSILWLYEVYHVRLGLKYTSSNIAIFSFCWKFIYIFKMGIWDLAKWFESVSWKIWHLSYRFDLRLAHHWQQRLRSGVTNGGRGGSYLPPPGAGSYPLRAGAAGEAAQNSFTKNILWLMNTRCCPSSSR